MSYEQCRVYLMESRIKKLKLKVDDYSEKVIQLEKDVKILQKKVKKIV